MINRDYGIGILGVGKRVPEKMLANEEVEKWAGMEPGEIEKKTGVKTRYICEDDDTASGLSAEAGKRALDMASVDPKDLGVILGCTSSGDYKYPAMACRIHALLGAKNAAAYDLQANCTGFTVGLGTIADKMYCDPSVKYGLVVGTAIQSRYLNWKDADSAMYFGDAAAVALLGQVPAGYGVLATESFTNSRVFDSVRLRGGGSTHPMRPENVNEGLQFQEINGMEVWKQVVQNQPKVIRAVLKKIDKQIEDVDYFIFHQANLNLIQFLMGKLRVDMKKTFVNVEKYGNTAEASIPLALCEAVEQGKLKRGDLVVLSGVGAGFTFGATALRWY